jgi:hypothetical protein
LQAPDVLHNLKEKKSASMVAGKDFSTRTVFLACMKAAKTTTNEAAAAGTESMVEQGHMD